jgi:hypothetical protein
MVFTCVNITTGRFGVLGKRKIALGHAARHLHVHQPLDEVVAAHEFLFEPGPLRGAVGVCDPDLAERAVEPREMRLVVDQAPVEHGADLVDAVGEQEAAIHDRDRGLLVGHEGAIDVDDASHVFLGRAAAHERRPWADKHEPDPPGKGSAEGLGRAAVARPGGPA